MLKIRKARISDVKDIHKLINEYAKKDNMIPRALNEIYERLRDFIVCDEAGKLAGVCALHILWEDLAEVRSLAVRKDVQNHGIGGRLVKKCLSEAKSIGIKRVFVLTYRPDFFRKMEFEDIDKSALPHKIWSDCIRCPKFPECNELALIYTVQ